MTQNFNIPVYSFLLAMTALFYSCSNDEALEAQLEPEQTLTADSSIVEMMKRISSNDGSYDNIVDGASCVDIQFPYTVTANGSEITIATMEDLQKIEDIFDTADGVDHDMEISFPITITTADYTELTINSEEELLGHTEDCVEGGDDRDMECIDLIYPATVFSFNPSLQQTGNVTVNHDEELRRFLAGLAETDLLSFDFPLAFELFDGVELTVGNNSELSAALERAVAICDEDDDNDYNDDDFTLQSLDSLLVTCPWSVEQLTTSNQAVAEEFQEYLLIFNEDGSVVSDNGYGTSGEGQWSVFVSDFKVFLELALEDAQELNGTRYTYEIGEGLIKGEAEDGNTIILEQACGYSSKACEPGLIEQNLRSEGCTWTITDDEGEFFEDLVIDFSEQILEVLDAEDALADQGSWIVAENLISFNDLEMALADYVGDWEVSSCSDERFTLQRGDEVIVLVKRCDEELEKSTN